MNKSAYLIFASGLLLLQLFFYYSLRWIPEIVEEYYSTGIYPYISKAMRFGLGWIPFSFGDLVYSIGIIMIIRWLILYVRSWIPLPAGRERKPPYSAMHRHTQLVVGLNVILGLFHMMWGFNYYRLPLHQVLEIEAEYTTEELQLVIDQLIITSNQLHTQLQPIDSLAVAFEENQATLFNQAPEAFDRIDHVYPALDYGIASIKKSMLTMPLSHMGYSGYLNPITGEAQTNAWINNYKTPVLILHEMSHQLGFAKENEANFIAIIAGMNHSDPYFQYSASIFALRYCLSDLSRRDPEVYQQLKGKIRPGIFANYQELRDFWIQYEGIIEEVSQVTYNTYLKANNQPDGMQTYSYVVALLVNYFK
ncbi:DUF3810 domain-containing protein [Nonlabens xiamenensis]|uniref:DUF3810 domain-containing protein n=1 Tax=Nonlabens xiamenensis TaxID=2341043 RepID=UPI000F6118F1|nr:DUF3810 domain-containing protein [Nonlabens xiamenensis]